MVKKSRLDQSVEYIVIRVKYKITSGERMFSQWHAGLHCGCIYGSEEQDTLGRRARKAFLVWLLSVGSPVPLAQGFSTPLLRVTFCSFLSRRTTSGTWKPHGPEHSDLATRIRFSKPLLLITAGLKLPYSFYLFNSLPDPISCLLPIRPCCDN